MDSILTLFPKYCLNNCRLSDFVKVFDIYFPNRCSAGDCMCGRCGHPLRQPPPIHFVPGTLKYRRMCNLCEKTVSFEIVSAF